MQRRRLMRGAKTVGLMILIAAVAGARAEVVRFDGDQVVRVRVQTMEQWQSLLALTDDIWREDIAHGQIDVRVTPAQRVALRAAGLPYEVLIENVQALIDAEQAAVDDPADPFDDYMPLPGVVAYLDTLVALRPDLAQTFVAGQSLEGRDIVGIRITGPGAGTRPGVLFHGGQHAREWITVPTILYLADTLLRQYDSDPYIQQLVDGADWYLIPVMNPDGYDYTWTTNRLWRKNRRDNGNGTFGVDLNRNWGAGWGVIGSSSNPGHETYHGTGPFSEPETQVMRDFVLAHPSIAAYCDIHSFGQYIMFPYGYKTMFVPEPYYSQYGYLAVTQSAIIEAVHGEYYIPGPLYYTLYPVGGGSIDWVYETTGAFSFTYELRDRGQTGFLLPPEQIRPTAEEVTPALLFYADYCTEPVNLMTPNGGQILSAGENVEISWFGFGEPVAGVDLYYSTDGGHTYPNLIATGLPHDGTYTWTAPALDARHCRIRIVLNYASGGTAEDTSDADFVLTTRQPEVIHDFPLDVNPGWHRESSWHFAPPQGRGGEFGGPDPVGGHTGDNAFSVNFFGDYANNQPTRAMTTDPLDCSGYAGVKLAYWRWLGIEHPYFDVAWVAVSLDGVNWPVLWFNLDEYADHEWHYEEFDLTGFADLQPGFQVQWNLGPTNPTNRYCGWNIDDIQIIGTPFDTYALGDMTCDNLVDNEDIDPFVLALDDAAAYYAAWPNCDRENADINQDGAVNNEDIDAFVLLLKN